MLMHWWGVGGSLNDFKSGTFIGPFPNEGVASMAVKGLRNTGSSALKLTDAFIGSPGQKCTTPSPLFPLHYLLLLYEKPCAVCLSALSSLPFIVSKLTIFAVHDVHFSAQKRTNEHAAIRTKT